MKRTVSLWVSVILLAACSGCFVGVERDGRDGDHDRGGYGDRDHDRDRDWDRDRDRDRRY